MICCPTCPDGTLLEEDEGEMWCPAEERAVTYGELRAAEVPDD